ncbi:MAG TPA: CoA pyrophosphatase [Flavipsychrobacter sp.]|nr:CoA pyrophosphatase [Flavipsychrobacter sp.]
MSKSVLKTNNLDIEKLKLRLQQELPGKSAHDKMMSRVKDMPGEMPKDAKPSAVLIVLFPVSGNWHVLYIQRAKDGHAHSGQIGFPGGKQEPDDANLKATALREAHEEVGIMSQDVEIIGQLTSLYIPVSNFNVYPFVALAQKRPEYRLQTSEVAGIFEVPLAKLLHADTKNTVRVTSPIDASFIRDVPAYQLDDNAILWGATAMITSELEAVLETIFTFDDLA